METRIFIPGSEWAYFKLYTGTKTADAILKNELLGYVKKMQKNNTIDKWFFIRYSDPDFHIRLRLHLNNTRDFSFLFNQYFDYFNPIVDTGLVWKIQCDTYQREMERYGSNTISIVEDMFYIDSEYIIRLLHLLGNDDFEQLRWKLALILIDSFLSAFSFSLSQRKSLLNTLASSYKNEFGFIHHHTTKQLNDKYRFFRKDIENVLLWENEVSDTNDIIKARRQAIYPITEKLILMEKSGELQVSMDSLVISIIHMTLNRWFRTKNRLHEMVIYEFLSRYYTSEIAKNNKNIQK
ncbi:MAG: thiopeptide-type bacteriocin biosynthesis protein [Prevotellaceae bacterium]|jgi:thiopeptide-type bacteriocin biosynthesis protein|nr:thiopeptide-type bacteriocin biosynthesis protein [Prevotellaceae bacterium]